MSVEGNLICWEQKGFSKYHISSKNSAPLIIRHPFTEIGQITGKEIPKY